MMVILEIKSLIPKLFILKIFSFILISYFSDFVLYWYTLIRSTKPCIDLIKRLQLYNIWFFNQKFQTTYLEKQGCFFIALHHVTNRFPFLVLPKSGSNGLRKLLQKKANIWGRMPVAVRVDLHLVSASFLCISIQTRVGRRRKSIFGCKSP